MPRKASSRNSAPRTAPKLTGIVQPRLWTPPLRPLNRKTSRGYEVADFAEMIGAPLMPWQRWLAIHGLETVSGGAYRFRVILILVGRQNGKSKLGQILTLYRMYIEGVRTVLGVAQGLSLAREQWMHSLDTVRDCPDLAAELAQVRNVNGDEWWKLTSGARYLIRASNREAGRGLSIDHLVIDELREWRTWEPWSALYYTTMARPDALILAMSNAGDDQSIVLNQLRDAALAGSDPTVGIFEWSAPDGCDLDDRKAWAQANPGLGHTISEAAIATAKSTAKPDVFRTEVLCQRVDQLDSAVDMRAWQDCADRSGAATPHRHRAACVDVALDGRHVTLAVAAKLPDGRVRVQIAAAWDGTNEARAELGAILDQLKPAVTAWYPSGPAAAIAPILRARKGSLELTGGRVTEACQGLADLTIARGLLHDGDPLLSAHIGGASKLNSGDGWRFVRRGSGHCDAAYAAAGSIYAALTMPPPRHAQIRVVG